jgi:hypothetical protein
MAKEPLASIGSEAVYAPLMKQQRQSFAHQKQINVYLACHCIYSVIPAHDALT